MKANISGTRKKARLIPVLMSVTWAVEFSMTSFLRHRRGQIDDIGLEAVLGSG